MEWSPSKVISDQYDSTVFYVHIFRIIIQLINVDIHKICFFLINNAYKLFYYFSNLNIKECIYTWLSLNDKGYYKYICKHKFLIIIFLPK